MRGEILDHNYTKCYRKRCESIIACNSVWQPPHLDRQTWRSVDVLKSVNEALAAVAHGINRIIDQCCKLVNNVRGKDTQRRRRLHPYRPARIRRASRVGIALATDAVLVEVITYRAMECRITIVINSNESPWDEC